MARHQVSATRTSTSEHVRLSGPRDAASPRRDALAPLGGTSAPRARLNKTWLAAGTVAVLLLIFIVQNTARTNLSFLGLTGTLPLAVALLAAALAGALLAATVAMTRDARLRRRNRG
jgi:uncharacterized integral membrane protein